MKQGWRQVSKQLEAGLESSRGLQRPRLFFDPSADWPLARSLEVLSLTRGPAGIRSTTGVCQPSAASAMEIQKIVEIKGPFFDPKKVKKKQPRNMGLPSSRLQLQMWLVLNLKFSARIDRRLCNTCTHMKGPKLDLQMEPLLISRGSTF